MRRRARPGLPDADGRGLDIPALVFRSGASDPNHTRATSEQLAALLPNARLVEPPWGDDEWNERSSARPGGAGEGLFVRWPCWPPSCWPGPTMCSDHPFPTMEEPPCPGA